MDADAQSHVTRGGAGPVRVVIADDHDLYRRGMQVVVELDGTAKVVGEASNGAEAVDVCVALRPDIVLMDVRMPGFGGIEACRRIRLAVAEARILMLTMSDDESDLFEAIKAGADYLVIGRPIVGAPDREAAAEGIIAEIGSALRETA